MLTIRMKSFELRLSVRHLASLVLLFACLWPYQAHAQAPTITSISPTSGPVGTLVTISGSGFGATQGSSTISLNATSASAVNWSDTSILALVPTGASSGPFSVTVNGHGVNSSSFTVTPRPSGWSDGDIGSVGIAGSATYANGVFTVKGSGTGITSSADQIHFAYQPLSGDGTIVARVVSDSAGLAGVMIRETLNANATYVTTISEASSVYFYARTTTGGGAVQVGSTGHALPYWVKVTRSGSTFTSYASLDGVNWIQLGTETITMATNTYVGLVVSSVSNSTLATATFDNVSVSSTASPAPQITSVSATTGSIGGQVTITGSAFGSVQGSSSVTLNGALMGINSWSDTSITVTIPSGATSGPMVVCVGPVMNNSNPVTFQVTTQPLPASWLNQDVGMIGIAGSATYANGVFTVKGSGTGITSSADQIHFAYQPLSGDGTIVARVVSDSAGLAGVMIRETLNANATYATTICEASSVYFYARTTTGGGAVQVGSTGHALPYWVKVTRSGSTFSSYASLDGVNWTQLGTETITMATNTYVGLVVSSVSNSTLATATFDNVSVSSTASPAPQITSLSATTGPVGSQIVISGTGFGASQNGSAVTLAGTPVTVNSWTGTAITVTIPTGAMSGPIVVSVAPSMTDSNPVYFDVTTQPLPTTWLDQDLGAVAATGSATFANGVYTITGSGNGMSQASDNLHFVYEPLSGDGSIVARLVSSPGGEAGVMIRETLNSSSTAAFAFFQSYMFFGYRTTTGAAATVPGGTVISGLPYWLKLARSGNAFTAYISHNGLYWTQLGTTQTIAMATNVYIGLAVSGTVSASDTSTFDNVSINSAASPAPSITNLFGTTGPVGSALVISGAGFGVSQGNSLVFLNGTPLTITNWTNTSILATVPTGATSGDVVVSVGPNMNDSNAMVFNVTASPLPVPWLDQDVGVDGLAGSATFANGTFTVQGAGAGVWHASDAMHFVYQGLSGDGSIIARLASSQGTTEAGVMIRQSLDPGAASVAVFKDSTNAYISFGYRTSAGASTTNGGGSSSITLPYWVKLVRAGNTFSAYISMNGYFWTQLDTTQTITMPQDVLIGLFVDGQGVNLGTATFDGVSVSTAASPAPVINALSATTGPVGSEIQISGSGFGSSAGSSIVTLNGSPVTIDSWDSSSIIVTIPIGATSGPMVVSVAPSMNDSNPVGFTVTSQALPLPWLDQDIGPVSIAGSATYSGGVFTVKGAGNNMTGTADGMHFLYQPLTGDGSIVARLASVQGTVITAAAMIRGSLDPSAVDAYTSGTASNTYIFFYYRSTAGGTATDQGNSAAVTLPYWLKVVRNGNTLTGYMSPDGVTWSQVNASETITMPQTIYVGMAVGTTSATLSTATFDNVSIVNGSTPVVTGISPALAGIGWSITITGSNFGATQGTSTVTFNGAAATSITSWSNSQIVALVPAGATTGPVAVTVNSIQSVANPTITILNPVITSVSPPGAEIGGQVTINGSGFGNYIGSVAVNINGVAQHVFASSDTSIQFSVVSGTTSGSLDAVVQGGITSNSVPFTIEPTISITGISPTAGSPADVVTITGTGFGSTQSDSVVTFDGVTANVITWSDTSIQAVVPAGAATGPVTVEVADRTADGPVFTVSGATVVTDSLGNQSTYVSAIAGGNWDVTTAQGSGCSSCTIRGNLTYQYDISGHVVSTTDELGNLTSNTYDSNGNVTSVTQPTVTGGTPVTTYTYNSFGEVLKMTDPLGNVTTNTYDAHGNLLTVTTPKPNSTTAASVTQFAYNSLGELTSITDPLGRITAITYTPQGYIATITDPQNNVTTYAYDSRGNRTSVTDAMSNVTTFAYDTGNRLTGITYPDQTTAAFTYDYRGRRITATDQNGKTATYAYDDADRLTSVTDAAGNVTSYTYDTENNLLSITDANLHTTNFAYDAFGRVTKTTFPSGNIETYQYDADNNLTSKTDRNGNTIQYVYDALNRLTQKNEPGAISAEYTYDLVGKILQVNDPTGTYAFAYDNMGRLTGTTTTYSFLPNTPYTNAYSYDADSNRTGFTAPDGSTNTYTYDTLNRLTTLANSWAGSFGFSYDALSRRTQMTRPNGIATNYSYDKLSHLLSVLHQAGTSTIDGDAYTLDAVGNRTAKTDYLAGVTSNYTYDKIYELTQVMQGTNTTESYSYDPVGNRLSSLGAASYSYNNSNELTSSSQGGYTYDANGNTLTDASGKSYAWDFENRLKQVTLPNSGGTVTFLYDPFGRRIQKVYTNGATPPTTTTTNYLYNGDNAIETVDQNGNVLSRFAQGQNIDEPLAESVSGATSFYEQDGLGSVTSMTSGAGVVIQTYAFDSFGKLTVSSGSVTNPFRYTGREFDTETNLYYYRARYYDPTAGRFLSEDPARSEPNFYPYVSNAPTNWIDPTGETRKIPTDCDELFKYIQENMKIYESKLDQYDPTEDGSGTIPKSGGGFHAPGVHYWNLFYLQVNLVIAIDYWDNHCGGPGNKSPVCEEQRKKILQPVPEPIYPLSQPVVDPTTGVKIIGLSVIAGEALSAIGEYWWLVFAF